MKRAGDGVISTGVFSLYSSSLQSITVKQAPASVVVFNYSGVYTIKLPKVCDSAGLFVFARAEIATATNTVQVTAASGDRIYSASAIVTSITLDDYAESTLLFSDGLFWYTC